MRVIRAMRHPAGGLLVTSTRVRQRRTRLGVTGLLGVWLVIWACVAQPWLAVPTVAVAALVVLGLRQQRR